MEIADDALAADPRVFMDGAFASCVAEAVTLPLEVAKMRLQLQKEDASAAARAPRYSGVLQTFTTIARQERWYSLWKGLEAGLHKQVLYTGLRLGLYQHWLNASDECPIHSKVAVAIVTTGIGIVFANPSDVVQTKYIAYRQKPDEAAKVRSVSAPAACSHPTSAARTSSQAPPPRAAPAGAATSHSPPTRAAKHFSSAAFASMGRSTFHHHLRRTCAASHTRAARAMCASTRNASVWGPKTVTGVPLRSARHAYLILLREEGLLNGLYRGFGANFACNSVQGAAEIATYDAAKSAGLSWGLDDDVPLHLVAGMGAGLIATIVSSPFDVVATRLMAAKKAAMRMPSTTLGMMHSMWLREGIGSFYKGFGPNILRIGTFNVVMWLSYEQIRKVGV